MQILFGLFSWIPGALGNFFGFVSNLDSKAKLFIGLLGLALITYKGDGDLSGPNDLKPIMDRFESVATKKYCPDRLDEFDYYSARELLETLLDDEGISPTALDTIRNDMYVKKRIGRLIDFMPNRCKGPDGVRARDIV